MSTRCIEPIHRNDMYRRLSAQVRPVRGLEVKSDFPATYRFGQRLDVGLNGLPTGEAPICHRCSYRHPPRDVLGYLTAGSGRVCCAWPRRAALALVIQRNSTVKATGVGLLVARSTPGHSSFSPRAMASGHAEGVEWLLEGMGHRRHAYSGQLWDERTASPLGSAPGRRRDDDDGEVGSRHVRRLGRTAAGAGWRSGRRCCACLQRQPVERDERVR